MNTRYSPPKTLRSVLLAALAALVVAACGGGTGGTGATSQPTPSVTQGVVTAKGSIFVNGIEFSTIGASVKIDDNPPVVDDTLLKEGMVVKVHGIRDDVTRKGTATQVEARDILEGTISALGANTITVMGQVVKIEDNVTRLNDDNNLKTFAQANFQPNDIVEVHGFADDLGGIRASRVVKKTSGEFETKGFVTNITPTTFGLSPTAGGVAVLTVAYSTGQLPTGTIVGSFVEVKSNSAPSGINLTASSIQLEDKLGVSGDDVEVEGIVTSGTVADFIVNGHRVITNTSTLFEGGGPADFAVGVRLEAEGPLDANGSIVAEKISFESDIKIEGDASSVTATSLSVLGKSVAINQFTQVDAGIVDGTHVEVRAIIDRNNNLLGTRIVKLGVSTKAFLQGPVTAANGTAGTLTILGTAIVSDGSTQWHVSSTTGDLPAPSATFFSQVVVPVTIVKVKWDPFTLTTLPIKEAEIEIGK
jgi:uncharacterized protein DUF5666